MIKIRNVKLVIILECQNIKMFLQKVTLKIGLDKIFWLKKIKKNFAMYMCCYVINCWNILQKRIEKKTNQKESRIRKVIKAKGDKLYVKWKGYDG